MFTNTLAEIITLNDRLQDDCPDVDLYSEYPGRSMYGKTCIGFVTDNPLMLLMSLTDFLVNYENFDINSRQDNTYPDWRSLVTRQDSMGRSTIVYFPNWQLDNTATAD